MIRPAYAKRAIRRSNGTSLIRRRIAIAVVSRGSLSDRRANEGNKSGGH